MIQPKTQTDRYWVTDFTFGEADIEFIYQFFLEKEKPQTLEAVTRAVMAHRVAEERSAMRRRLSGRIIYQPKKSYEVGDELVFPALQFSQGAVVAKRAGLNPDHGKFDIIIVEIDGKRREFAAELDVDHPLNANEGLFLEPTTEVDLDDIFRKYGARVGEQIAAGMQGHGEFIRLANAWFVKGLLLDINIGHLHLAEAILEMNEGGPLQAAEILVHLDLDSSDKPEVQSFSLNYALQKDDRFDEVGPRGKVLWFLHRLEPADVQEMPQRLRYEPIHYDKALISPQLLLLERELDDEWSDLKSTAVTEPVTLTLTYPHRWAGTLPLSSRTRALFDLGQTPRQIITFIDEFTGAKIQGWVVQAGRYVAGLADWFEANDLPIGGYIRLKKGAEPGTIMLGFDQRRPQREWVRLATAVDDRIKFELSRRSVGCGYDDQLIVGTDYVAAMDALFQRAESRQRSVVSLLAELFPDLAELNPQNTVHAKTLYSAVNILRRIPPGPLFAELVRHPAFQAVGDNYWQFNSSRWQRE